MEDSGAPTDPEDHPAADEEYTIQHETELGIERFNAEEEEHSYAEEEIEEYETEGLESTENLAEEGFEHVENSIAEEEEEREELQNLPLKTETEDMKPIHASPLIIEVPGILDLERWTGECMERRTSTIATKFVSLRAGLIRHVGTEIDSKQTCRQRVSVKKVSIVQDKELDNKPLPDQEQELEQEQEHEQEEYENYFVCGEEQGEEEIEEEVIKKSSMLLPSVRNHITVPSYTTSIKDRMSIFRGKYPTKFLGKLFVTFHDKLIMEKNKQTEKHLCLLDNRPLFEKCLEKRKLVLDQAKKDTLIILTDGKLFGRQLLSIGRDNPDTAYFEAQVLNRHIVPSPLEAKACIDKIPVQQFVRKILEEHATIVFSCSICLICAKLLTLLNNANIKYLQIRLDKMGVYGDNVNDYLRDEYSSMMPSNVYYHGLHPEFVKKSFSVVEKNSESDSIYGLFPDTYDLIVIGCTSIGLQAVYEARRLGARVCLVDSPLKPSALRPIALLGKSTLTEPDISKKLLYHLLSLRYRAKKYYGDYDKDTMEKLHSDWMKMTVAARSLIEKVSLNNIQSLHNVGAGFLNCGVKFLDRHKIEITNSASVKYTLRSSYFILANPMQHRIPNIPGKQYCLTPDQIFSLPNSPGKTLIYGSSRTAIEYAGLLGSMGFPVTVMVPGKVMEDYDSDMVECITNNLKRYGITIVENCVLTAIKLVSKGVKKGKKLISKSDESLYQFKWNPLLNMSQKKKRGRRGRFVHECGINKMIEQVLLAWDVSPKVLKSLMEARPSMKELEEANGSNRFDAVADKKKFDSMLRQKAAIQRWFTVDKPDTACFERLRIPKGRRGKRSGEGKRRTKNGTITSDRKKILRTDVLRKFVRLFLSSTPDEKTMSSLDFIQSKRPALVNTGISYGPHYSFNPKSRVGVYFPGGTALRLSKKSKYYKYLTPIKPSQRFGKRKELPFLGCKPEQEVMACLLNLKAQLEDGGALKGCDSTGFSLENIKGMRADDIMHQYDKKRFEILDKFKSQIITVDDSGDVSYSFEHNIFETYVIESLKNIDLTIKKILIISREIDFKSQCVSILRFLTRIVETLRMFHLYIGWKIKDSKTRIRKPSECRDPVKAFQSLKENVIVKLECKAIRRNMFQIVQNLESLMTFTFISACNVIVTRPKEGTTTDSDDLSNRGSSLGHANYKSRRNEPIPKRSKSRRQRIKSGPVPFNIRRFYNKSRYIRTYMGGEVDLFEPHSITKGEHRNILLQFEGEKDSPFKCETETDRELAGKSSVNELNSQLKNLVSLYEQPSKVKKMNPMVPKISENIIDRLKAQNANKISEDQKEPKQTEQSKIVCKKESLLCKDIIDVRSSSPHPLPDRKKIEYLRLRGVRSELSFAEFKKEKLFLKTVTGRLITLRHPDFSDKSGVDIEMGYQILLKQIIDELRFKNSKNRRAQKMKLNFRNFVTFNFGRRIKLTSSLTERDNYLSKLVTELDAKPRLVKPLKWNSLATHQHKVSRDRHSFIKRLQEKQKVRLKRRRIFYKYAICDSLTEKIGLSTASPINTNSMLDLANLQKIHPELFESPVKHDISVKYSVLSFGSVINDVNLGIENREKSSNYLNKIMENKTIRANDVRGNDRKATSKASTSTTDEYYSSSSEFEDRIEDRSLGVLDLTTSVATDSDHRSITQSAVSSTYPHKKIENVAVTNFSTSRKADIKGDISKNSMSSSNSYMYLYSLKPVPCGIKRLLSVNLESYMKGEVPIVDLRFLGMGQQRLDNTRTKLNKASSLNIFSETLDFYESLVNGSFSKQYYSDETFSTSLGNQINKSIPYLPFSKVLAQPCDNMNDGSSSSPKPSQLNVEGVSPLQMDGGNNNNDQSNLIIEDIQKEPKKRCYVTANESNRSRKTNKFLLESACTLLKDDGDNNDDSRTTIEDIQRISSKKQIESTPSFSASNKTTSRPPKPGPLKIEDGGSLQVDGGGKRYTKNANFQKTGNRGLQKPADNINLLIKKCTDRNKLKLRKLYGELSEDTLSYGVIPLDGRTKIEHQLDQKLKKIRDEARSFIDLVENLKQYTLLKKIVKLCKLHERCQKVISEPAIDVQSKPFPDNSVLKVKGKYQYELLDDFVENFNTVIIAGKHMSPAQDINFHDIGVSTCCFDGRIHTNVFDQTTVSNVYGIGECVYGWPFENNGSIIAAKYLVRRLFSEFDEIAAVEICMRTLQTYPVQYAYIGLSEEEARKKIRNVVTYKGNFKTIPSQWFSNDEIPSVLKFVCQLEGPGVERVVGIHFYNEQASDVIQGYATAVKNGLFYKEVQDLIAVCPVSTECTFEFYMERKEYENLEINEDSKADSFESYSSSLGSTISPYEETEPEDLKSGELSGSSEHSEESIQSEIEIREETESSGLCEDSPDLENDYDEISDTTSSGEIINDEDDMLVDEDVSIEFHTEEGDIEEEEIVELSDISFTENEKNPENLDSTRGLVMRSQSGDVKLTTDTSETRFLSISTPEEESTPRHTPEDVSRFAVTAMSEANINTTDGGIVVKNKKISNAKKNHNDDISDTSSSGELINDEDDMPLGEDVSIEFHTEEEGIEEEEIVELSDLSFDDNEKKTENLDSTRGLVMRSQSGDVKLTTSTSETWFLCMSNPEEESTPRHTPEDVLTYAVTDMSEAYINTTDGGKIKDNKLSKTGENDDEHYISLSETSSSASFRTAIGFDSVTSLSGLTGHKSEADTSNEVLGSNDVSTDSLTINDSSEEQSSDNSYLSGRIVNLDSPEVFIHFTRSNCPIDIDSSEPSDMGISKCPYGPDYNQGDKQSDKNDDESDESLFDQPRPCSPALRDKSEEPTTTKETIIEKTPKILELKKNRKVRLIKYEEDAKQDYSDEYSDEKREVKNPYSKIRHTNKWNGKDYRLEVRSAAQGGKRSNLQGVAVRQTQLSIQQRLGINQSKKLVKKTQERLLSLKQVQSKKRLMKSSSGVNYQQRNINRNKTEKPKRDACVLRTEYSRGNSKLISEEAKSRVSYGKFKSRESTQNASGYTPQLKKKVIVPASPARNVFQRWNYLDSLVEREKSKMKKDSN